MQLIRKNQERFRAAWATCLLLLYLTSWVVVSGHFWLHNHCHDAHSEIHSHDHHHGHSHDHNHKTTTAHSKSGGYKNQDPCHLRVYHPLALGGCEHAAHWVPVQEDCKLCDCLLSVTELEFSAEKRISPTAIFRTYSDWVNHLVPLFGLEAYPLRGPPSLV
ncbi:MAG: hypothetical protein AAFU60_16310 [Bacteroidota bacterium]